MIVLPRYHRRSLQIPVKPRLRICKAGVERCRARYATGVECKQVEEFRTIGVMGSFILTENFVRWVNQGLKPFRRFQKEVDA